MKRLALAATAAVATVSLGAIALFFVPVLALTGGGPPTAGLCGVGGDVGAALATIRQLESGNNYTARAAKASASGAYQFLDSTWRTWSAAAGYPGLYPSAYLAPPHIQDAAAAAYVQAILDQWHDIAYVPINWYYPAAARNPALMDIIPAPQAGNRLTIRQYQTRWLNLYQDKLAGADPGDVSGGSCATGDTATVVAFARAQLGKPYLFATAGPDTYDCSGLTLAAYATIGIQLPHLAADQAQLGVNVPIDPGYSPTRRSHLHLRRRPPPRPRPRRHRHLPHRRDPSPRHRRRRQDHPHPLRTRPGGQATHRRNIDGHDPSGEAMSTTKYAPTTGRVKHRRRSWSALERRRACSGSDAPRCTS